MRAYELMVIVEGEVDEAGVDAVITRVGELISEIDGVIHKTDKWGKKRFAYPIDHKEEGNYFVLEFVTPAGNIGEISRYLGLADTVVRSKMIRLPDDEAQRRELLPA